MPPPATQVHKILLGRDTLNADEVAILLASLGLFRDGDSLSILYEGSIVTTSAAIIQLVVEEPLAPCTKTYTIVQSNFVSSTVTAPTADGVIEAVVPAALNYPFSELGGICDIVKCSAAHGRYVMEMDISTTLYPLSLSSISLEMVNQMRRIVLNLFEKGYIVSVPYQYTDFAMDSNNDIVFLGHHKLIQYGVGYILIHANTPPPHPWKNNNIGELPREAGVGGLTTINYTPYIMHLGKIIQKTQHLDALIYTAWSILLLPYLPMIVKPKKEKKVLGCDECIFTTFTPVAAWPTHHTFCKILASLSPSADAVGVYNTLKTMFGRLQEVDMDKFKTLTRDYLGGAY